MHLLYCDETNLEERSGDFLIYGGLMIPSGQAEVISSAIEDMRKRHGVPGDYWLKFNPGPGGFSHSQFIALKEEVFAILATHGAKLIIYVILHDIASNADEARRNGINTVCYHFHCAINRLGGSGLVLVDRFNDAGNRIDGHLREKFTVGLRGLPYSSEMRLPNILGFHYSTVGQSHFPSLVDVALGSLRFAINAHTREQSAHLDTALRLLQLLAPLMIRNSSHEPVQEIGFVFSPKVVRVSAYRERYQRLKEFLESGGIATAQEIVDHRQY